MIKKMEHVALIVTDIERSIEFYSRIFSFRLRTRGQSKTREMAFLYLENEPGFEIELIRDLTPQGDYSEKGIVNHLAFTVMDIEEAMAYFKEKGIVFHSEQPNPAVDGGKTVFFHGPDRELLQLVEPNENRKQQLL